MEYIVAVLIGIALLSLWAIVAVRSSVLALIMTPFVLYAAYSLYVEFNNILGYPITKHEEIEFILIDSVVDTKNKLLYIWIVETGDDRPRAYAIDMTDENKKALEKAARFKSMGLAVAGHFTPSSGNKLSDQKLEFEIIDNSNKRLKPYER